MIKNSIIYKYSEEFENKWAINKDKILKSKLSDCLEKAKGFSKPKLNALIKLAQEEKLLLSDETNEHYILITSCNFRARKLLAGEITPFVPVKFNIWLRKKSSSVVTFDSGRKLSGVGIALLAYATTANPAAIEHLRLEKHDFLNLKDWLLPPEHTGEINRVTMHNIEYGGSKFKQIVLSANQLEDSYLFNELLDPALAIANISFKTPPLNSSGRSLSCRINHWGGLTIYTPNLLNSEISELIGVFEKLFFLKE